MPDDGLPLIEDMITCWEGMIFGGLDIAREPIDVAVWPSKQLNTHVDFSDSDSFDLKMIEADVAAGCAIFTKPFPQSKSDVCNLSCFCTRVIGFRTGHQSGSAVLENHQGLHKDTMCAVHTAGCSRCGPQCP